jgi:hypothetical protein
MSERVVLEGTTVQGLELRLGMLAVSDLIRDNAHVIDCSITIGDPKRIGVFGSRFSGCRIHSTKTSTRLLWRGCVFRDCKFTGLYRDCTFAASDSGQPEEKQLVGCDFSMATLHFCRFANCALDDLVLPMWPHFTVKSPAANRDAWTRLPLPNSVKPMQEIVGWASSEVVAITLFLPLLAEEDPEPLDVDGLHELCASQSFIIC